MNILHCNTYDSGGGAAIAARRLHIALMEQGVASRLGVLRLSTDTRATFSLVQRWRRIMQPIALRLDQLPLRACTGHERTGIFTPGLTPSRIHHSINKQQADILHLHWIAHGFIPTFSLQRLQRPVVWTLHDTWAFTGGCHILKDCTEYLNGCRRCPQLAASGYCNPAHLSFRQKMRAYKRLRPHTVAPSRLLAERIRQSPLLGPYPCEVIPNPIDTRIFQPVEQAVARQLLNIPPNVPAILFGAFGAMSDPNKGFDLLIQTLERLPQRYPSPVHLLVFGASQAALETTYPVHCLSQLHDAVALRLAYAAADVFVCPSREENLPNTVMESLACGTPVAGFHVGGIPDMVEHEISGWLAPCYDTEHLARGIAFILEDTRRRRRMGEAGRAKVVREYAADVVARRYIKLYDTVLAASSEARKTYS